MKISRAIKRRKRLEGQIAKLRNRISNNISELEENMYEENYGDLTNQLDEKIKELLDLKEGIMEKNVYGKKYRVILEIAELKGSIEHLKGLPIRSGMVVAGRYSDDADRKWKTQLTNLNRNKAIDDLEDIIVTLTEELDDFNGTTEV